MPGYRGKRQGGSRDGKVGKAYGNRSDLNGGKLPIATAKGQAYGEAKAQADAQSVVPMGGTPPPAQGMPAIPEGMAGPGSMPGLSAPSADPDEDVMSGAAIGPGPGPDAFGYGEGAKDRADQDWVRQYMPAMTYAANNGPKASDSARQIIRLLRAKLDGTS